MKNIKQAVVFLLLILPTFLFAQESKPKNEVIYIQTSAVCDECKERIESSVKAVKGVKEATLELKDKKIKVVYSPAKTSAADIKNAIAAAGYDANDVQALPAAYGSLPMCCKKEGDGH